MRAAALQVCQYDPRGVALDVGKNQEAIFTQVAVVRFRKQLSTRPMAGVTPATVSTSVASNTKEHSVFVVNAQHLIDFLEDFDIDQDVMRRLR